VSLWIAAARRFAVMLAVFAGATASISLVMGLLIGSAPWRALSVGFYVVGCFLVVIGFFLGNRGPLRLSGEGGKPGVMGMRGLAWASPTEREETINSSALFVTIGGMLIGFGILADTRYPLL
jgi:hypothetical protein